MPIVWVGENNSLDHCVLSYIINLGNDNLALDIPWKKNVCIVLMHNKHVAFYLETSITPTSIGTWDFCFLPFSQILPNVKLLIKSQVILFKRYYILCDMPSGVCSFCTVCMSIFVMLQLNTTIVSGRCSFLLWSSRYNELRTIRLAS